MLKSEELVCRWAKLSDSEYTYTRRKHKRAQCTRVKGRVTRRQDWRLQRREKFNNRFLIMLDWLAKVPIGWYPEQLFTDDICSRRYIDELWRKVCQLDTSTDITLEWTIFNLMSSKGWLLALRFRRFLFGFRQGWSGTFFGSGSSFGHVYSRFVTRSNHYICISTSLPTSRSTCCSATAVTIATTSVCTLLPCLWIARLGGSVAGGSVCCWLVGCRLAVCLLDCLAACCITKTVLRRQLLFIALPQMCVGSNSLCIEVCGHDQGDATWNIADWSKEGRKCIHTINWDFADISREHVPPSSTLPPVIIALRKLFLAPRYPACPSPNTAPGHDTRHVEITRCTFSTFRLWELNPHTFQHVSSKGST